MTVLLRFPVRKRGGDYAVLHRPAREGEMLTRLRVVTSAVLLIATALVLLVVLAGGAVAMADGLFGPEEEMMMIAAKALAA